MLGKKLLNEIKWLFTAWEENAIERDKDAIERISHEISKTFEHCDKIEAKLDRILEILEKDSPDDYYRNEDGLYSYKVAEEKARLRHDRPKNFKE